MNINLFSTSKDEAKSSLEVVATDLCSRNSDLQEVFILYETLMKSSLEVVATDLCSRTSDLQEVFILCEKFMNNSHSVHQVCQTEVIQKLKKNNLRARCVLCNPPGLLLCGSSTWI